MPGKGVEGDVKSQFEMVLVPAPDWSSRYLVHNNTNVMNVPWFLDGF